MATSSPTPPAPNPGKAAVGQRVRRLEPDPSAAPVVERNFDEYLSGRGLFVIAEGLTRDGVPSPSAHDPARNRHRVSSGGAWSKSAVRSILGNPRYTGRQVWNRQRRDEVLYTLSIKKNADALELAHGVADGHTSNMRWNDRSDWIQSNDVVHEPLISPEVFARAQEIASAGARRPLAAKRRRSARPYVLSGLVFCGICGRRMQGSWNHGAAHYRCKFPAEYALVNRPDHPRTVYIRESRIFEAETRGHPIWPDGLTLDGWLAFLFASRNLDTTLEALASVGLDKGADARAEAADRMIEDCDARLAKYRAALEAGGDPVVIAGWMQEVQAERLRAEREMARSLPAEPLSKTEIKALARSVRDPVKMLAKADPALKAEVYAGLGLHVEWRPSEQLIAAEIWLADACTTARVGGGT
jgi:site-specific DNA recombinase